eukprot:COSAG05_NODE_630_length_8210_cov_5.004563_3_plen_588_part_00
MQRPAATADGRDGDAASSPVDEERDAFEAATWDKQQQNSRPRSGGPTRRLAAAGRVPLNGAPTDHSGGGNKTAATARRRQSGVGENGGGSRGKSDPLDMANQKPRTIRGGGGARRRSIEGSGRAQREAADAQIGDTLARCNDSQWSIRAAAFDELRTTFCAAEHAMDVLRSFGTLVECSIEHANDAHHRVCQAVLTMLASYFGLFADQLESYLERILPKVFLKISDAKEGTRDAAVKVLEAMRVAYSCEVLLPLLLRTLEHTNTKVRLSCIDFLHYLLEHCQAEAAPYLSSASHMKAFIARLCPLVTDKNAALRKLAARTLAQLHSANAPHFLAGMAPLPLSEQTNAKKAMEAHVIGLDAELADYIRGGSGHTWASKQPPAPAPAVKGGYDELSDGDDEYGGGGGYPRPNQPSVRYSKEDEAEALAPRSAAAAPAAQQGRAGVGSCDDYQGGTDSEEEEQLAEQRRWEQQELLQQQKQQQAAAAAAAQQQRQLQQQQRAEFEAAHQDNQVPGTDRSGTAYGGSRSGGGESLIPAPPLRRHQHSNAVEDAAAAAAAASESPMAEYPAPVVSVEQVKIHPLLRNVLPGY